MKSVDRPLRVFLCHSSADKPAVRELYQKLRAEPWIQPWLDEENIFPGDNWNFEIQKAIRETDAIIVCLSKGSITKEGYVQKEIKTALDYSDEKPDGTVYIIPIRLEECAPPGRLSKWQYADYFEGNRERGLQRLLMSLEKRAISLKISVEKAQGQRNWSEVGNELEELLEQGQQIARPNNIDYKIIRNKLALSNNMEFMRVPAGKFLMGEGKQQHTVDIPYDYWMARFPVTNVQYSQFKKIDFDKGKENHPVAWVTWSNAMEYCEWLNKLLKKEFPSDYVLRLPNETEWEKAARGTYGFEYPWGNQFDKNKCNSYDGGKGDTTPVGLYSPQGDSPYGCADMSGNIWEWVLDLTWADFQNGSEDDNKFEIAYVLCGGSFRERKERAKGVSRLIVPNYDSLDDEYGFRVCLAPPHPK